MSWTQKIADFLTRFNPLNLLYSTYEQQLINKLDKTRLPHHIAVLADGNRRWARMNAPGEPLVAGYRAGARKLLDLISWCAEVNIEVATLWVLSTDNLSRSESDEITPLLEVICDLVEELARSRRGPVQIVGDLSLLDKSIAERLKNAAESTKDLSEGIHVNVAVAYGGRHELRDAVRDLLKHEANQGKTLAEVAESLEIDQISNHLYTKGQPDPDLLIRTSGEQRLSGFMMWQSAHSELYFCEALWPDFRKVDFYRALRSYTQRERRYGR